MDKIVLKPYEICDEILDSYTKKAEYPVLKSVVLGLMAGGFIALGGFASSLAAHSIENVGVSKLVAGAVFPVGLILVLLCGVDLFTGNILLTVPFAEKKVSLSKMLRNWLIIYFSNMVGAVIISFLIWQSGLLDTNNMKLGGYLLKVAANKASLSFVKAFSSGILCNIVVCLAVWISYSTKEIAGKILAIWFPIMAFIVSGFEHSVANMYYFSVALMAKTNLEYAKALNLPLEKIDHINIGAIVNNLIAVTLGNIIGGGVFVGLAMWVAFKYIGHDKTKKNLDLNI